MDLGFLLPLADNGGGIVGLFIMLIQLALVVAVFAGWWKVFEKAGRQGWEGIVPIYNAYILVTAILNKEILYFILLFIPCVNFVIGIILMIELAKAFGKDAVYGIGMALLGFIFVPLLGFGDAQYIGAGAGGDSAEA